MALPPPKLKAFVATIKEQFIDNKDGNDDNLETFTAGKCFEALIRLEVAFRGVLISENDNLFTTIQSTAGKPLISADGGGGYPKPLLCGSSGVAGKLAEKVATLLDDDNNKNNHNNDTTTTGKNKLLKNSNIKEMETTKRRCKDVQEVRLLAMIEVGEYATPDALWEMAQGYYYRAASFQPDVPLHYKMAWDVLQKQNNNNNNNTWQAVFILEQLKRIAISKNNMKRATEMALHLTEAYLQHVHMNNNNNTFASSLVLQTFVAPYKSINLLPLEKALREAQQNLHFAEQQQDKLTKDNKDDNNNDNNNDLFFLLQILAVELAQAEEESMVQTMYKEAQEKAQRRGVFNNKNNNSNNSTISSGCMLQQTWQHVYAVEQTKPIWDQAISLRNTLLQQQQPEPPLSSETITTTTTATVTRTDQHQVVSRAWQAVARVLKRCRDYVRAVTIDAAAKNKSKSKHTIWPTVATIWKQIAQFAQPFWEWNGKHIVYSLATDTNRDEALQRAFLLVPCIAWMTLSSTDENRVSLSSATTTVLENATVALQAFLQQAQEQLKQAQSAALSAAGASQQVIQVQTLELALLSTRALWILSLSPTPSLHTKNNNDNNNSSETMTTTTTTTTKTTITAARSALVDDMVAFQQRYKLSLGKGSNNNNNNIMDETACEYGTYFLVLLVAWSGLHRPAYEYMTFKEAAALGTLARRFCTQQQQTTWSRPSSKTEELWLDLCEADAQGAVSATSASASYYQTVLDQLKEEERNKDFLDPTVVSLIRAHCLRSLADIGKDNDLRSSLQVAQQSLDELAGIDPAGDTAITLYPWKSPLILQEVIQYQLTSCRHQVADFMIRLDQLTEARTLLEQTVKEFPTDIHAAFALGAFLLQMDFHSGSNQQQKGAKESQIQLLKAAKLDGTKPGPFALLGYWYESNGDVKRSIGCYSKALVLDPAHPVAGRGLLRLVSQSQLTKALDAAVQNSNSPLNGWAWHAIGANKVQNEGDYDMAVVALLRAARSRDIDKPDSDKNSFFYDSPKHARIRGSNKNDESISVLSLIGQCYRFLGRYTASLRTYYSALDESGDTAGGSLLCACAQVEMQLGLFREAAEKFTKTLELGDKTFDLVATLGLGMSQLSIAQVEVEDGKAGAALGCLKLAIERCNHISSSSVASASLEKLRGDLHSYGAFLPIRAFGLDDAKGSDEKALRAQIDFVSQGEAAYRKAEENALQVELPALQASLISDCAMNILLRAQLLSIIGDNESSSNEEFERSATEYRRALEVDKTHAPAWCGLGCASHNNPLLAQHAFSRSIELDPLSPGPYANLGFLYTAQSATSASRDVSATLTQIADTPMTWINRAFLLEKEAVSAGCNKSQLLEKVGQALDAYRASLQVTTEPSALLGVSANGLVGLEATRGVADSTNISPWEVKTSILEYSTLSVANEVSRKINQVLKDCERESPKTKSRPPLAHNLSQSLLLGPHRADLWLKLAKQHLSKATSPDDEMTAAKSANAAAVKAVQILQSQLEESSRDAQQNKQSEEHYVDADTLSEALVLTACTQLALMETGELDSIVASKDLQKALLVSPWNQLARKAL